MHGADILVECLKAQGVRALFGMPGTQNIHLYDALLRRGGIDHYLIRNEQGATLMANGYARATGEVGVALTVPGPGSTNAATGLGDALTDCVPVLLVTGGTEVAHDGRDRSKVFHSLDQAPFFAPISRFYARPERPEEIPAAIAGAFAALRAPRPGPAVIEIPSDVAQMEADVAIFDRIIGARPEPDPAEIAAIADLMTTWQRPALLVGNNVIAAGATAELQALAEALSAPALMTRLGKGALSDAHPLCVSSCSAKLGRQILAQADGLLIVGARLTQIDTAGWTLELPQSRAQLDPDPAELGREVDIAAGAAGDLRQSLALLLEDLQKNTSLKNQWNGFLAKTRTSITAARPPLSLMATMRQTMADDAIAVVDVTSIAYRAFDEFPVYQPRTFLYPCYYVTLGYAVAAAIGAKVACPERQVVAFCGDGGFQMTACELATAAEYGIGAIFVVVNDGGLLAIRGSQETAFDGRTIDTDMQVPHLADMARAMGVRGVRIEGEEGFADAFAEALQHDGPTVIEVMMVDRRDEIISRVPWIHPD